MRIPGLSIALLAVLGSTPELHEKTVMDGASWWSRFVAEMEAIGCVNIHENPETGEWEFQCPAANVKAAQKIVANYKARE